MDAHRMNIILVLAVLIALWLIGGVALMVLFHNRGRMTEGE